MIETKIAPDDLKRVATLRDIDHLGLVLEEISTPEQLMIFFTQYVAFNSVFAGGAARLVSDITLQQDVFMESETLGVPRDCRIEIANSVFSAVIDDFHDREHLCSHRLMAEQLLWSMGELLDMPAHSFSAAPFIAPITAEIVRGYGVRIGSATAQDIFYSLGFHIGSEYLADEEFNRIDGMIGEKFPDLKRRLQEEKKIAGRRYIPYRWIEIHKVVEEHHCDAALDAANAALNNARVPWSLCESKTMTLEGFRGFSELQNSFMDEVCGFF